MTGSDVGGVSGGPIMEEEGGTRPGEMTETNESQIQNTKHTTVVTNEVHLLLELSHEHKREHQQIAADINKDWT